MKNYNLQVTFREIWLPELEALRFNSIHLYFSGKEDFLDGLQGKKLKRRQMQEHTSSIIFLNKIAADVSLKLKINKS